MLQPLPRRASASRREANRLRFDADRRETVRQQGPPLPMIEDAKVLDAMPSAVFGKRALGLVR
ncbi:MAG: hypothetical protein SPG40_09505 [Kiritimatiellia bacterium]|nr:hypothetical protein [Kiritimatiellia bacterium]